VIFRLGTGKTFTFFTVYNSGGVLVEVVKQQRLFTRKPSPKGDSLHGFMRMISFINLWVHCNENPIYMFPEKELRGLSPNFDIHVSVSDLYTCIPRIGPHIFL